MDNNKVHLIINKATNVVTVVTNAPKSEENLDEAEGERRQIFKITGYEEIDVPDEVEAPAEATP